MLPDGRTSAKLRPAHPVHLAVTAALLITIAAARLAAATGINLSWNDCGTYGTSLATFSCDSSTGPPFALFGSFVPPPGIDQFVGMTATLTLASPDGTLPDWWRYGNGYCRGNSAITTSFDFTQGPFNCVDFYAGMGAGGHAYDVEFGNAATARLRIQAAVPIKNLGPLDPSREYYAFQVNLLRTKTTGAGSCGGCTTPMSIELDEVQLFHAPDYDNSTAITAAITRKQVFWQQPTDSFPSIRSFTPAAGAPGAIITIVGWNLTTASSVRFGGVSGGFNVANDSTLLATLPGGARTGQIQITTPRGVAHSGQFIVAPVILGFAPDSGATGSTVIISGYNFTATTSVQFNGIAAMFSFVGDVEIPVIVPAGATDGPITVTNPGGSAVSAQSFHVTQSPPGPEIYSFSPSGGSPGTVVTIHGAHFTGTTAVRFQGLAATFVVESDSVVTATVPSGAHSGSLAIETPDGTATVLAFVVAPVVNYITPQAQIGSMISISGYNFSGASAVTFTNGVPATFNVLSDISIRAVVPSGTERGPISVTNAGGTGSSIADFRVGPPASIGIDLSWEDCGGAGPGLATFACDTDSGPPFTFVGSFVPPAGIDYFVGMSTSMFINSASSSLPDWWKYGVGQCRGTTALSTNFDFTNGPFTCTDPYLGQAAGGFAYDVGFSNPNTARFRIQAAIPIDSVHSLEPGIEYYAFMARITRAKSAGAGSCLGCDQPMCISLEQIQLYQPPQYQYDPIISNPYIRSFVKWQGEVPGCPITTGTAATTIEADATLDHVHLVWALGQGNEATVYRRSRNSAWSRLAHIVADGTRRITYDDRDVVPGASYDYRLGISAGGSERFEAETSVTIPAVASLAIGAVLWDRTARQLNISFTLPRSAPAILEVFDPVGRRWAKQNLESMKPGTHVIRLTGAPAWTAGVYFARMKQGELSAARRFVVYR